MNRFTLPCREATHNPLRTLLAVLSVAIGVSAVVAVRVGSNSAQQAFYRLQEAVTGRFDLEILSADATPFDASAVDTARAVPGVTAASPLAIFRKTALYAHSRRLVTSSVGVDPRDTDALSLYSLDRGRLFDVANPAAASAADNPIEPATPPRIPVLLEATFAKAIGKDVGDPLRMLLPRGPTATQVVGIISLRSAAGLGSEGSVFFPLDELQRLIRSEGQIHLLRLVLDKNADRAAVQAQLAHRLGDQLEVRVPITRTELAADTLRGAEFALLFAQALGIVIAVFIIYNTFLISLGHRRRQWSILRAVGTTRGQVLRQILVEASLLGLAGSVLGLLLGLLGAQLVMHAVAALLETPSPTLDPEYAVLALAALLGPALTLLACYLPARKASAVSPIESMRGEEMTVDNRFPLAAVVLAGVTYASAFVLLLLVMRQWLPPLWSVPAGVLMLLGFVFVIAPLLSPLAHLMHKLGLNRIWPAESELAERQIFRNQSRAVLTTGVLVVSLGNGIGLGHAILNTVADVHDWYDRTMSADVALMPANPQRSAEFSTKAKDSMEARIEALPGVRQAETIRVAPAQVRGLPAAIVVREFSPEQPLPWEAPAGDDKQLGEQLRAGQIVIGSALANRAQLTAGDQVRVELPGVAADFRIAAVVPDYIAGGLSVYVEREKARSTLGIDGVDLFLVSLTSTDRAATDAVLAAFCVKNEFITRSFADLRSYLDSVMGGVVAACWVVLILGFFVAGFGVFNTLAMNVLEQTRDLALLRIIGLTRKQIGRTILSQAFMLGGLAVALGTAAGLTTAVMMHRCMELLLVRHVPFTWHPGFTLLCNAIALLIVMAAAWLPARRAARTDILGAVQYE